MRLILLGLILALAAGYAISQYDPAPKTEAVRLAPDLTVASVHDGDTLRLSNGERVRLAQVDAPERKPVECWGREAGLELKALVGKRVTLTSDPAIGERDHYGRQLAYVFLGRVNMNVRLVQRGAATPYFFRRVRGMYAEALMGAAQHAIKAREGLWGSCIARLDPYHAATTRFKPRTAVLSRSGSYTQTHRSSGA